MLSQILKHLLWNEKVFNLEGSEKMWVLPAKQDVLGNWAGTKEFRTTLRLGWFSVTYASFLILKLLRYYCHSFSNSSLRCACDLQCLWQLSQSQGTQAQFYMQGGFLETLHLCKMSALSSKIGPYLVQLSVRRSQKNVFIFSESGSS